MCEFVMTPYVTAGWICHACRGYNGLQRDRCKDCGDGRCRPLKPSDTGECFETYADAYKDDPGTLSRINEQLAKSAAAGD